MTVRLWVDGEDYGIMSERSAELYRRAAAQYSEQVTIEPVEDCRIIDDAEENARTPKRTPAGSDSDA